MTPIQRAEVRELELLFKQRQEDLFIKESRISASQSHRTMKVDLESYSQSSNRVDLNPLANQNGAIPSYLLQKARRGQSIVKGNQFKKNK